MRPERRGGNGVAVSEAVKVWMISIAFCMAFASVGASFAAVFGLKWLGCLLAGMAVIGIACGTFFIGSVGMIHALEKGEIQHINDGKDVFFVELRIGPFKYRRTIPSAQGQKQEMSEGRCEKKL